MEELQANHFSTLQDKEKWIVRSKGKNIKYAIDNDLKTFFTTKRDCRKEDFFEIDFKETKQIAGLSLDVFEIVNAMPAEVTIAISSDGKNWVDIKKTATAGKKLIDIMFDKSIAARFLKITPSKVSPAHSPWNINNIEVYGK